MTSLLAKILETFKLKNPKVWGVIMLALMVTIYFLKQGSFFGIIELKAGVANALEWVATLLTALTGAQTFKFLPADWQEARKE